MPSSRVLVNVTQSTAYTPQETFNDLIVFTRSTTAPPGPLDFNQKKTYRRPTDVAADLGTDTDAHIAAQALDAMGVTEYAFIVLEDTETTETLGDSDSSSVDSGSVSNAPMGGNFEATVSVDGTELTSVEAVTDSPPDATESPPEGTAYVNYDTGEVVVSNSTSGSGEGIEVTYRYADYVSAFEQLNKSELDLATFANLRAGKDDIGDLDELVQWASGDYVHVEAATENFAEYPSEADALEEMQDVAAYIPSGDFSMTAHKSDDDVANFVAGLLATQKVWEDPSYHDTGFPGLNTAGWTTAIVGDPETTGTIEGGIADGTNQHAGAMNALDYADSSWVLSNDLTTLGHGSAYKYLDERRTEGLVVEEATSALIDLIKRERVPFTKVGENQIHNALHNSLSDYSYARGPYSDLDIDVPPAESLDPEDRANRIWGVISLSYRINGDVHRFSLDIRQTV